MPIFVCIILGSLMVLLSYFLIEELMEVLEDDNSIRKIYYIIMLIFLSLGISAFIYGSTIDYTQKIMEDYHRGKIETVITTIQSEDNLIKQDTIYRYKY